MKRLSPPLVRAISRSVVTYLSVAARLVYVRVFLDRGEGLQPVRTEALLPAIEEMLSSTVLLPLWNAHSLLLLCAYLSHPRLRGHLHGLEAVADDTPGGLVTRNIYGRIGLTGRRLSRASQEDRLLDLRDIFLQTPSLVMVADSHGPYRTINNGFARFVRQYCGSVRPVSAVCDRSVGIFRSIKMSVPLPGSRILVGIGKPIAKGTTGQPIATTREAVETSLSTLEKALRAAACEPNRG